MLIIGIDTALVSTGICAVKLDGTFVNSHKPYPKKQFVGDEDSFFQTHERIRGISQKITNYCQNMWTKHDRIFLAFEDYPLTGRQRSYKIAEMHALLKDYCWDLRVPYCLVHPLKTLKYVRKARDVTKTEYIEYVKQKDPQVFEGHDRADYSDVAAAWCIAQIGRMVVEATETSDPINYTKTHPKWETRWKEILLGETGILEKPGLIKWRYDGR